MFDLLGDLGGVTEIIMIVFGFILFSISEHSFYLTASQKLYYARTAEKDMFLSDRETESKWVKPENFPIMATEK